MPLFSAICYGCNFSRSALLNSRDEPSEPLNCDSDYLESKSLFVDVHDKPTDINNGNDFTDTESDISEEEFLPRLFITEEDLSPTVVCNGCDKNNEASRLNELDIEDCDSCKLGRAKSLQRFWKERSSLRDSLKDSIRNILETVGTMTSSGSLKVTNKLSHTKKCVSLSELTDSKPSRTTLV